MLEIEAQARRIEVNRTFHVCDQVANTVKRGSDLRDSGRGSRLLRRRIHHDVPAFWRYEEVPTLSTEVVSER